MAAAAGCPKAAGPREKSLKFVPSGEILEGTRDMREEPIRRFDRGRAEQTAVRRVGVEQRVLFLATHLDA